MRRRDFLRTTGAAAAALVLHVVPLKGSEDSKGAIRAALCPAESESEAGWVLLNTNPADELMIKVHLDYGLSETTYGVDVSVEEDLYEDVGELTTNENGKGNVRLTLPVTEYAGGGASSIDVQVFLQALS
ncbi:MAG: twin-arginine translocation signal domain-containing protein [Phycisphaerales bacterium]|nr:MAG: twin-arginine translocation signal domain-containing protein [Phycisphaerales bacterium]